MKKCPMCAEQVQDDAKVCRFCQHRFGSSPPPTVHVATSGVTWVGVIALVLLVAMCVGGNGGN